MDSNKKIFKELGELIDLYKPTHIVLDCDGTLYPNISEARRIFNNLLDEFFLKKFGYSKEETAKFVNENKVKFNTVSEIAACILGGIDAKMFTEGVIKQIPVETLGIKDSLRWVGLLKYSLPLVIFTNNSSEFAFRIAEAIGISKNVERIFGEVELGFVRKPDISAYKIVSDFLGSGARVLYFDDSNDCLVSGKKMGWVSILSIFGEIVPNTCEADAIISI